MKSSPKGRSGGGKGATINIVVGASPRPAGPMPAGIPGGLPPAPIAAPMPPRPPVGLAGAQPPAMKRGGRVMAGSGSGLGRLYKSGR